MDGRLSWFWCYYRVSVSEDKYDTVDAAASHSLQSQHAVPVTSTPVKLSPAAGTTAAAAAAAAVSCDVAAVDLVTSSCQLQHLALIYSMLIRGKS